jgi:hypothetical protein
LHRLRDESFGTLLTMVSCKHWHPKTNVKIISFKFKRRCTFRYCEWHLLTFELWQDSCRLKDELLSSTLGVFGCCTLKNWNELLVTQFTIAIHIKNILPTTWHADILALKVSNTCYHEYIININLKYKEKQR